MPGGNELLRGPSGWIGLLGAAALVVAGCASSGRAGGNPAATTTSGPVATSVASRSAPSGPSTTLWAAGAVPTVAGATDLRKEPTIAAGHGAAPAKLTGRDLVVGKGPVAGPSATVTVQYVGALWAGGKVFDASWSDQGPVAFRLDGVIPGFKDAIIGMRVGGRREIAIPPALGYGAAGQPPAIPPNATLVFVIDLLQVDR